MLTWLDSITWLLAREFSAGCPLAPVVWLQPVLLVRAVVAGAVSQGLQMVSVKQEVS